jgi:zinc transport system substrate-binding protein
MRALLTPRLARPVRWLAWAAPVVLMAGCSSAHSSGARLGGHRLNVVASLFPLAETARRVGGTRVAVTDLSSPGSDQLAAGVVIEIGHGFQPAIEKAASDKPDTVAVLPAIGGDDPHVWLDPVLMQRVVRTVADGLDRADPGGKADYDRGARDFMAELGALDISYRTTLSDCPRHDIVTLDGAFGRLAARYGLTQDTVTGPVQLADLVRAKGVTTVFTDALVPADVVQPLVRDARLKTEVLDPIVGPSATEVTYRSRMAANLDKLRAALGCVNPDA